jgi:alkylresorcinol/alkylpyrone synthase
MPKVVSIATQDAPTRVGQDEVKEFARGVFSSRRDDIDRLIGVFNNTSIQTRHFTEERSWYSNEHGFAERNRLYVESAAQMSASCAGKCLSAAGIGPKDFDHVIFVSSTGISTPSIDARIHGILGFGPHVRRTPIWGIGCAGGAVGLSRALEYTLAMPEHAVLLIAIELCGLTFQKDDYSKSNLIGTSLFSDGAAAVLVAGDKHPLSRQRGLVLLNSLSTIYDSSLDIMGWDVKDSGLKVIFSRDIPTIVRDSVRQNIEEIASSNGLGLPDIKHYVIHPGGPKVIDAYEEALELHHDELRFTRKVLSEHGNMSSPTVLYVLKEFLENNQYGPDEFGLISALGPGFSSELVLFRTE